MLINYQKIKYSDLIIFIIFVKVSSSGKQVIALGIITGLLVTLFYGLTLLHWINKKRSEPTKDKQT